jgi:hypothetical protein
MYICSNCVFVIDLNVDVNANVGISAGVDCFCLRHAD